MVTEYFFNFSYLFVWKNGENFFPTRKNIFPSRTIFFPTWKNIFPIFSSATLQMDNEISNQNNFLGLRKDRKQLENGSHGTLDSYDVEELFSKGPFKNYVDQFLTYSDHLPTYRGLTWTFGALPTPCPRGHRKT